MRQPAWDKYETALLIEAYWKIQADHSQKGAIIAALSSSLRERASFEIDDTFRNENGMLGQLQTIEDIMAMEETKVGRSMAALCSLLNKALTAGTVLLPDLWDNLQQELGYYDTGVCCYLIGFAMHFYIGKFTWFDGNNAHKLDEETISTLIVSFLLLTIILPGMLMQTETSMKRPN